MKKILIGILLVLLAGAAHAIPVPFAWSGGTIKATGALALASYSANPGSIGPLANGQTHGGIDSV